MSMGRTLRRTWLMVAAVGLAAAVAGCDETPAAPSTNNPLFTQRDLRVGTGVEAQNGKQLTVHYTGWLYDESRPDQKGLQFETSVGGTPFTFTLGIGDVIPGWDQGLVGMKVGGLRRLVVPSSLAYGGVRQGPIPPFATLVFEVDLVDIFVEPVATEYAVSFRSDAGQYLSVRDNANNPVTADRTTIGDWERFKLFDINGGALETGDTVRVETASGWGFVPTASGPLSATAPPGQTLADELFVILAVSGTIGNGSQVAMRTATSTTLHWSAEGGGGGAVNVASRSAVGSWETFRLIIH